MKTVRILLVGIGGYASKYVNPLLDGTLAGCEIAACADPYPDACGRIEEIRERGIPLYADMKDFFTAGGKADLAILTTPIHLHAPQILLALENGCHVLCEKPLCGDAEDIPALIRARDAAGKYVDIGFQLCHSEAMLRLKQDVLDGVYGAPKLLKTVVLWPRTYAYYSRGCGWAGKIRAGDGSLILDSVANNATAHYLNNMLFILGDSLHASAMPEKLEASLWRAFDIENYDTACFDMEFASGARALFYGVHSARTTLNPIFEYTFEKGTVTLSENETGSMGRELRGVLAGGTEIVYGDPFADSDRKLYQAVEAVRSPDAVPFCSLETAAVHTKVIAWAQKTEIRNFPAERIVETEDGSGRYVAGIDDDILDAYRDGVMWRGLRN